jgi:hypothetical protein
VIVGWSGPGSQVNSPSSSEAHLGYEREGLTKREGPVLCESLVRAVAGTKWSGRGWP